MDSPAVSTDLRLLLATSRPAVRTFFESLGFPFGVIAVGRGAVSQDPDQVANASAVVIDVSLDPNAAIGLCEELRAQRPELPVIALVCCPHAITPWDLRALAAAGVTSLLDLRARAEDVRRALSSVAHGDAVLHLQLGRGQRMLLQDIFGAGRSRNETQLRLLELVSLGLPDHEIGRRLHLSPHTVKHRTEQLRADLGVRNRTELAAWAGRHGFYVPEESRRGLAGAGGSLQAAESEQYR